MQTFVVTDLAIASWITHNNCKIADLLKGTRCLGSVELFFEKRFVTVYCKMVRNIL